MSPEKIIHGYQRTLRLEAPRRQKTARAGRIIHGGPYPLPHNPNTLQIIPLFGDTDLGSDPMSPSAAIDYWKKDFEEATRLEGKEAAWLNYSTIYFGQADEATRAVKSMKAKIEAGVPLEDDERFYTDPEFFRQKLLAEGLTSEELYKLFLIVTRMDIIFPGKREEFDSIGFSLGEKADRLSRGHPKYKLALWKEHDRKRREKAKKRKQEKAEIEKQRKKQGTEPELINHYTFPELGKEFTTLHYIEKVDHWTNILEEVSKGRQIDYQEFRKKHAIYVEVAKIEMDDRRGPDKRRKRYTPQFFEDLLNYEDLNAFNAYYWGLVALYTPTKIEKEKSKCELLGFLLLEAAHALSVIERKIDGKNPTAFYPWAIKKEYLVKMARPGIQSKRQVRSRDVSNMITRAGGGEPEQVRDRKRPEAIDLDEEIPF